MAFISEWFWYFLLIPLAALPWWTASPELPDAGPKATPELTVVAPAVVPSAFACCADNVPALTVVAPL